MITGEYHVDVEAGPDGVLSSVHIASDAGADACVIGKLGVYQDLVSVHRLYYRYETTRRNRSDIRRPRQQVGLLTLRLELTGGKGEGGRVGMDINRWGDGSVSGGY